MIQHLTSAVSDLKGSPALLAIVLLQFATMAMVYFISSANAERVQERELALIETCQKEN
jgi:hypothetical protein